jgi:DNA-binding MarR family transcriptional regulator
MEWSVRLVRHFASPPDSCSVPMDEELKNFLRERVHSYEELEILLFCRQSQPGTVTAQATAERLKMPRDVALEALEHLREMDLLEPRTDEQGRSYRYCPLTPELGRLVDALTFAFEDERLPLVRLMNENAVERVRTAAMRLFADSFVVSKKRGRDG